MKERIAALRRHLHTRMRRTVGATLIIGGILGFLPILGFWMFPLGLLVLSDDIPWVRRQRAVGWKYRGAVAGGQSARSKEG